MFSDQDSIHEIFFSTLRTAKIERLCILLQKLCITAFSFRA